MSGLEFRPIPRAPGYFATNTGEVITLSGWRGREIQAVSTVMSGVKRYPAVRVMVDGRRRTFNAHVLIAEAFHGPRPDGMQVRHLDGDPTNNRPDNLRWGTAKENSADRIAHGRQSTIASISNAKLTAQQVREIRARFAAGETHHQLAVEFDLSPNYIHRIARRESWKHVA